MLRCANMLLLCSIAASGLASASGAKDRLGGEPDAVQRAEQTLRQMTHEEKTVLTHGLMALQFFGPLELPQDAVPGAGYIAGIPRLAIPSLRETDASLGVAWVMGARKDGATALPSGVAMASSWNPELVRKSGAMIGAEARAKGFNVLLAGGTNLMRDPRNGRTFEYFSEDPLLSGTLVGNAIAGVQSNHIISTIKHFALNDQETGRNFVDVHISEPAARESDLLAFQLGIEIGRPGSVMCAYNKVNGTYACENPWLLDKVLKEDWGYKGFVMSDWGAVHSAESAVAGLDQQSGAQLDPKVYLGQDLSAAASRVPAFAARLDDMNRRILTSIYANGLDSHPAKPGAPIDAKANSDLALEVAKQGMVLLRNERGVLPLAKTAQRIAVIGGYAETGVLSGAGSSQVHNEKGPAVAISVGGEEILAQFISQQFHSSPPVRSIKTLAPKADVRFRNGRYISEAVAQAREADVAIVFATQWMSEGIDQADLSLPEGQDALIAAVADANPNTIVVLETGGPVKMPWLGKTAAVLAAWYPGARGGEAIASVLFGDTNPSGHLPITFPTGEDQLPRPVIDGSGIELPMMGLPVPKNVRLETNYDIEGSDVGYRWNARRGQKALFPFGYGLSYTTFALGGLKVAGAKATFSVRNTGHREGATVAQLYLVSRDGRLKQRLVGYRRVQLAAGGISNQSVTIDPRLLADWQDGSWVIPPGKYEFALGDDAEHLGPPVSVSLAGKRWKD